MRVCRAGHLCSRPCAAKGVDGAAVWLRSQRARRLRAWAPHRGEPAHLRGAHTNVLGTALLFVSREQAQPDQREWHRADGAFGKLSACA